MAVSISPQMFQLSLVDSKMENAPKMFSKLSLMWCFLFLINNKVWSNFYHWLLYCAPTPQHTLQDNAK